MLGPQNVGPGWSILLQADDVLGSLLELLRFQRVAEGSHAGAGHSVSDYSPDLAQRAAVLV